MCQQRCCYEPQWCPSSTVVLKNYAVSATISFWLYMVVILKFAPPRVEKICCLYTSCKLWCEDEDHGRK
jgi:hypothetical protein